MEKEPTLLEIVEAKNRLRSINEKTPISLSLVISLIGLCGSFFYMYSQMASKDYVERQITEIKTYVDKDAERTRSDLTYIRSRVDEIYKFINHLR